MKKSKVVIFTDNFYPDLSSGGRLLTDLAIDLAEDFEMQVIAGIPFYNVKEVSPKREIFKGIEIFRVWNTKFSRKNLLGRVLNELSFCISAFIAAFFVTKPDVVMILSSPPFLPFFIILFTRLRRIPSIIVMMDVFPDIAVKMGYIKERHPVTVIWNGILNISLKFSDKIVVLGRCMQKVIQGKILENPINLTSKISIIHNWSNKNEIFPIEKSDNTFKDRYPLLSGTFNILYSGNLGRFQDFETILQCAKRIEHLRSIQFIIAGEGARKDWLADQVKIQKLQNIHLLPFVPQEELNHFLNFSDVGLITLEKGAEGLGVPSKFYPLISAGKPIIGLMSQTSEIAYLIQEEGLGFSISQGDVEAFANAVVTLYENKSLYLEISHKCREVFQKRFDKTIAVKEYKDLLITMISKHDSQRSH